MQTAFLSWHNKIGAGTQVAISATGDRPISPWVNTDSGQRPPRQLTAGSSLNKTAEGPWPYLLDAGLVIDYNQGASWPPSSLREVANHNVAGNYGLVSSLAKFSFRNAAFGPNQSGKMGVIGLLPNTSPNPHRPMWNNLPAAQYNLRVPSSSRVPDVSNANWENVNAYSLSFNQSPVASLNPTGATQSEVLL
jgi:hypothetical protein